MSDGVHIYDTYLEYSTTGAGGPFTELAKLVKIMAPKRKRNKADATYLRAPGMNKIQKKSWGDPGEAGCSVLYSSEAMATLEDLEGEGVIWWREVMPLEEDKATRAAQPFTAEINGFSLEDITAGEDKVHVINVDFAVQEIGDWVEAT